MPKLDYLAIILRVGVYAFLVIVTMMILPFVVYPIAGPLITASLCSFAAAAIANAIVLRIYERGQLADIGLGWSRASMRNLALGLAGGIGCGLAVTVLPVILRSADIV